jgi:hypothetical protein
MAFISNFWPAYLPVGVLLVAAVSELVTGTWKRRAVCSPRTPHDPGQVIVLCSARPGPSQAPCRAAAPAGAVPGRIIMLHGARRRRPHSLGESRIRRSHA